MNLQFRNGSGLTSRRPSGQINSRSCVGSCASSEMNHRKIFIWIKSKENVHLFISSYRIPIKNAYNLLLRLKEWRDVLKATVLEAQHQWLRKAQVLNAPRHLFAQVSCYTRKDHLQVASTRNHHLKQEKGRLRYIKINEFKNSLRIV